jgi:hypothetical protein
MTMRRSNGTARTRAAWLTVALTCLLAASADAQTRRDFSSGMKMGIGYSGVVPDAVAGGGVWRMISPRYGIFADVKTSVESLRDETFYCPPAVATCTVEWVEANRNDVFIRDETEYLIGNIGVMYAITREFMFMLGGGVARTRTVREYYDESEEPIVEFGSYYVDHEPDPELEPQAVIGMLMRAGNRLAFRFGYETAPGGMSIGAYFVLP